MSELPLFIFLGLTGMLGNQLLYIMGIYSSTPNIASVFQVILVTAVKIRICSLLISLTSSWYIFQSNLFAKVYVVPINSCLHCITVL